MYTYIMSMQPWGCNCWASKYNQSSIYIKYHVKRFRVFEIHMRPKYRLQMHFVFVGKKYSNTNKFFLIDAT